MLEGGVSDDLDGSVGKSPVLNIVTPAADEAPWRGRRR
jgi:hypothetical protein